MIDGSEIAAGTEIEGDICIIGSGPAGITLALELEGSGLEVVLLEGGGLDYSEASQAIYAVGRRAADYPDPEHARLRQFGGSSNHWEGNCSPFSPIDFERRDWVAHSGWPFAFADLEPHYAAARHYCQLPPEPAGFVRPLPADRDLPWARADGPLTTANGLDSPPTRFGEVYRERLEQSRNLKAIVNANVTGFVFAGGGERLAAVRVQSFERPAFQVRCRRFVLACGGLENPRLLLQPSAERPRGIGNEHDLVGRYFMDHPVVKGAMFQPSLPVEALQRIAGPWQDFTDGSVFFQLSESALREHRLANIRIPFLPVTRFFASAGVESLHALTDAVGDGEWPDGAFGHLGNIFADLDMVTEGVARAAFDVSLFDHAETMDRYFCDTMIEQTPDPENRVTLGLDKDALGLQKIDLAYRISEGDKDNLWRGLRLAARAVGEAGIGRMRLQESSGGRLWEEGLINYGHHHMGTTRAAASPRTGVVDGDLRVHGLSNLYVAGSSVFPTGSHVPPTLTVVALSCRLAAHLRREGMG